MANLITSTAASATYNTSEIMKEAWAAYDRLNCLGDRSRFKFNRQFFSQMLSATWAEARKEMEAAKLAALPVAEKSARREVLKNRLNGLDYLPVGMNVSRRAAILKDQISQLAA